ncbi:hypothetical protein [Enterocloster lavalensis]|uniref:hypothetical protein n=1 Tax=Enterocloster lavalensis TaxID=460384 RepID=UPI0026671012|nr:hypothetical protein [Enterocloster lavalensis]
MNSILKDRFRDELKTIKGYVDYIENNFYRRSCQVLRAQGFEEFSILDEYAFFTDNETEKEKNREILEQIGHLIKTKIEECTEVLSNVEKVSLSQISNAILENDLQDCLCVYIKEYIYDCVNNPNNLPYSKLIETVTAEEIKKEIDLVDEESGDKCYDMLKVEDYESILEFMRCTLFNEEVEEKKADLEEYLELQTLYSIFDEKAPINIYRQSFILLLTAFDAVIFDLVKMLFVNRFFDMAPYINYDKKFSLSDISQHSNFEGFLEKMVDTIIGGKYISDLLEIVYKYEKNIFNLNSNDCYLTLMEIIQRRNLHVHRKGIVDEKYFTKGNGNELELSVGDYAAIDDVYMHKTLELLEKFVANFPE